MESYVHLHRHLMTSSNLVIYSKKIVSRYGNDDRLLGVIDWIKIACRLKQCEELVRSSQDEIALLHSISLKHRNDRVALEGQISQLQTQLSVASAQVGVPLIY